MHIARWVPKAKTHSRSITLIAFTLQKLLHERALMRGYTCINVGTRQSGQIYLPAALPTRQELVVTVKRSKSPEAGVGAFVKMNISHPCRN
jgi:hypothetical protein